MGFPYGVGTQEKWEVENLCGLQRTEQSHQERPLPSTAHRSSVGWTGRKEVFLFPRWVQQAQLNPNQLGRPE